MLQSLAVSSPLILADFMSTLSSIFSTAWGYILIIFGFSVVVFVHELGHFLAAKWADVRVQAFAIGFGRRLIAFRKGIGTRLGSTDAEYRARVDEQLVSTGVATREQLNDPEGPNFDKERIEAGRALGISETEYRFNILPLGGYVQMLGQEDFVVDKSGELKVKADPDSFTSKPIGKRMVIVSAGVIMNLIFAAILFTVVNMVGMMKPPPIIGYVAENTPAARAGLLPGDRILEINGEEISDFMELHGRIVLSGPEESLVMRVERDGKTVSPAPEIRPEFVEAREMRQIGVAPAQTRRVWGTTVADISTARPDELHRNDEIHAIKLNGKTIECRDAGIIRREMMRAEGSPIDLIVKRPKNPDALTDEQLIEFDPPIETDTVTVKTSAMWLPLPYDANDRSGASLLGMVPRLTILQVDEKKSFDKAGAKSGDVIVRIGKYDYPTYAELESAIKGAGSDGVELEVRRKGVPVEGLTQAEVDFCIVHREELIATAVSDFAAAPAKLAEIAKADGLDDAAITSLEKAVSAHASADAWRKWFEKIDVVKLNPIKPSAPFALFSSPSPSIDADIRNVDEDHLVVADVVAKYGERGTPARTAGIVRGAVILAVNQKPVRHWYELSREFMQSAGKTVDLQFRLVDKLETVKFEVPGSLQTALGLASDDRVVKIGDKSQCKVTVHDAQTNSNKEVTLALPDWRAIEGLLKEFDGKKVKVEYVTADGERKSGDYTIRADNKDPWPARVQYYAMTFICYPLFEKHPIANPAKALVVGIRQAYRATVATAQTIRHMLFTRNVGLSNVSGPLGIAHKGSEVAQGGLIALCWFLGLISANLAVINFLPLPIVDGGLFLFLILEKIRGEPVSIKTQVATQLLGIALIATVFILVTYQDILRFFS